MKGRYQPAFHLVLLTVRDEALLGDTFHALGFAGVDEGDVVAVECRQILVVEGRAFAELPVPGLQGLGRIVIAYRVLDPGANVVHFFEVRQFRKF